MGAASLKGRSILVVEDEPLIAADIAETLQCVGASVLVAHRICEALILANQPDVDIAIVDWALGQSDAGEICKRLDRLGIPFVIYSGLASRCIPCIPSAFVPMPTSPEQLISVVADLLEMAS